MPSIFTIQISSDLSSLRQSHSRKLLNIEKEIFDAQSDTMYALVHVEREGISNDPQIQKQAIVYNIIVETLVLGSVPSSAIPLIALMIIIIFVVITGVYVYHNKTKTSKRGE